MKRPSYFLIESWTMVFRHDEDLTRIDLVRIGYLRRIGGVDFRVMKAFAENFLADPPVAVPPLHHRRLGLVGRSVGVAQRAAPACVGVAAAENSNGISARETTAPLV